MSVAVSDAAIDRALLEGGLQRVSLLTPFREATIDKSARTARVIIITEGLGNLRDRNYYTRQSILSAAKVFNGKQFYIDHPSHSDEEDRPERTMRDLAGYFYNTEVGQIRDPQTGEPLSTCFATLRFAESEPGRLAMEQVATAIEYQQRFPRSKDVYAGISINGGGVSHPGEIAGMDVNMVSEIQEAFSADIVTKPARGGKFLALMQEQWRSTGQKAQKESGAMKTPVPATISVKAAEVKKPLAFAVKPAKEGAAPPKPAAVAKPVAEVKKPVVVVKETAEAKAKRAKGLVREAQLSIDGLRFRLVEAGGEEGGDAGGSIEELQGVLDALPDDPDAVIAAIDQLKQTVQALAAKLMQHEEPDGDEGLPPETEMGMGEEPTGDEEPGEEEPAGDEEEPGAEGIMAAEGAEGEETAEETAEGEHASEEEAAEADETEGEQAAEGETHEDEGYGMEHGDVPPKPGAAPKPGGGGGGQLMSYKCRSCQTENKIMPPKGMRLIAAEAMRTTEAAALSDAITRLRLQIGAKEVRFVKTNDRIAKLAEENVRLRAENTAFKRLGEAKKALKEAKVPSDVLSPSDLLAFEPHQWPTQIKAAKRVLTQEAGAFKGGAGPKGGGAADGKTVEPGAEAVAAFSESYKK